MLVLSPQIEREDPLPRHPRFRRKWWAIRGQASSASAIQAPARSLRPPRRDQGPPRFGEPAGCPAALGAGKPFTCSATALNGACLGLALFTQTTRTRPARQTSARTIDKIEQEMQSLRRLLESPADQGRAGAAESRCPARPRRALVVEDGPERARIVGRVPAAWAGVGSRGRRRRAGTPWIICTRHETAGTWC